MPEDNTQSRGLDDLYCLRKGHGQTLKLFSSLLSTRTEINLSAAPCITNTPINTPTHVGSHNRRDCEKHNQRLPRRRSWPGTYSRWFHLCTVVGHRRHQRYNPEDRKSTRLNSSHVAISYAVFCLRNKTDSAR